jgi:hypothetical protein
MPNSANSPAPNSDPAMRAESAVVRDTPIVAISAPAGIVSSTSALRMPWSDGRINPDTAATANTKAGSSAPA